MKVILLSGFMKSGKDYIGNILTDKFLFKRLAFADKLKDEVSDLYKIDRQLMDTQQGKETEINGKSVRDILITHAQNKRKIDTHHWCHYIKDDILSCDDYIVITDWRFLEEFLYLKKLNLDIITIRIIRESVKGNNCETENELNNFNFDYILENNKNDSYIVKFFQQILKNQYFDLTDKININFR